VVTVVTIIWITNLVNKTKSGMAMRAVSKDHETASLMGVKLNIELFL
jgi:branched-chain amino acid transport system permease protein